MRLKIFFINCFFVFLIPQLRAQSKVRTFEKFWKVFEDNYAFFQLHHVDWHAAYQKFRPLVNEQMTEDSLFSVCASMLKPLGDSHVNLIDAAHKRKYNAAGPSGFVAEFPTDSLRNLFWANNDALLAGSGFTAVKGYGPEFKGKHLFYFTKSATLGYLRFSRCFARIKDGEIDEQNFETKVLDSLIADAHGVKALIIDVRANIGGDDQFSYEVAGRFASRSVIGHYKQERIPGTSRYTALQKWMIKPRGTSTFTRPVVILTNSKTVSAAEVFTLAMKQLPTVKTFGEPTEGNLSDMMNAELPNGWEVSLSNQRYLSPAKICYEGSGIPVDLHVTNSLQQVKDKRDLVLEAALKELLKPDR